MTYFMIWLGMVAAYSLGYLAERRRHQSNYYLLMSRGAIEKSPKLMKFYYGLSWVVLLAAATEFLLKDKVLMVSFQIEKETTLVAMLLIMVGFLLRIWVLKTLGWYWSKRLLAGAGFEKCKKGPYRFFAHPEYLARLAEGCGFCLFLGSAITGYVFLIASAIFYVLIAPIEMKHLDSSPQPQRGITPEQNAAGDET